MPNLWFFQKFISANMNDRSMKLVYSNRYQQDKSIACHIIHKIEIYQSFTLQKHEKLSQ